MIKKTDITKEAFDALVKKGHKHTFEVIYKLYYDKLLHIAISYLGSKEDAEGVVQNVFLKLWGQIYKVEEISNINAYLFTLTKNHCLDAIKHRNVKLKYIESKKSIIQTQYINDSTTSLLLQNELQKRIVEAIDKLPEKCKKIFIESRVNGRKSKEIAELYSISKKTVDNHLSNGIKLMRIHLKDFITIFLIFFMRI